MPVYNCQSTICSAIESIKCQSFTDWELILIDDFSTDSTLITIEDNFLSDKRIKLVKNDLNLGLAACLNLAFSLCNGKYVARMDADDISLPNRFELQIKFLDSNPTVDVLGSNASFIDLNGNFLSYSKLRTEHNQIKKFIHRQNPFIHPSVVFRSSFFVSLAGYDTKLRKKQDYDLWVRGVNKFHYQNLPNVLIKYRVAKYKPFKSDIYGLYVGIRNSFRLRKPSGVIWTFSVFILNLLRRVGYRQRAYRR